MRYKTKKQYSPLIKTNFHMQVGPVVKIYLCQKIFAPKCKTWEEKSLILEKEQKLQFFCTPLFFSLRNVPAVWRKIATSCPAKTFLGRFEL